MFYWPRLFDQDGWILSWFFVCEFANLDSGSVHKYTKRELGKYPAILASHLVNNPYICFRWRWQVSPCYRSQWNSLRIGCFITITAFNCLANKLKSMKKLSLRKLYAEYYAVSHESTTQFFSFFSGKIDQKWAANSGARKFESKDCQNTI